MDMDTNTEIAPENTSLVRKVYETIRTSVCLRKKESRKERKKEVTTLPSLQQRRQTLSELKKGAERIRNEK